MTEQMRIAVAGATGRLGRHLVDVLEERGHQVVPMSRRTGVDLATGEGLAEALAGVDRIIDAASWPTPDQEAATEYFTTATHNLQATAERAGADRIVAVSIIGCDRFSGGYNVAKVVQEREMLAGPVPAVILRAAQFHEFVPQMLQWGTQGDVAQVPKMRTQLVAARTVAEELADLTVSDAAPADSGIPEVAGPRVETLVEVARLYATRTGGPARVDEASDPDDPDRELFERGGLLPGPNAILAGPSFEKWLSTAAAAN